MPGTLLDTTYGLYACLKIIHCVVACGGNVFISGARPQGALSCLSGCEMYFLCAVPRSSRGRHNPGLRCLPAHLSFALLLVGSCKTELIFFFKPKLLCLEE